MGALPHVCFLGDQRIKWALDEDLRWAREALAGKVREVAFPFARIIHAAWWPSLTALPAGALTGRRVLCFVDNPPAFYLSQPEFKRAAELVDLWVARSSEAVHQFCALGLPVAQVPYCVDPAIFRPLKNESAIRQELGIPAGSFVVGNFHRDSEGADLGKPKKQKGPDFFFEIVRRLHALEPRTLVLLAGPRRHWLRSQLAAANIPFRFVGHEMSADDYGVNILERPALNRLYQALDACLVSSRWEGGPYSVLEALFAGRSLISTRVGIARDLLPEACLYSSIEEAVEKLAAHALAGTLSAPSADASVKARAENSLPVLRQKLGDIYQSQPAGAASFSLVAKAAMARLGLGKKSDASRPLPELGNVLRRLQNDRPIPAPDFPAWKDSAGVENLLFAAWMCQAVKEGQA
jgi:glycosyltransferase involved in cell wall biosynthesis